MRRKRFIAVSLIIVLLFTVTGCGSRNASGDTPGNGEAEAADLEDNMEERVTLTVLYSNDQVPADSNIIVETLNEKFNIDLQITTVAHTDLETKLNTLVASDALPDIISLDTTDQKRYIENDLIIPLDDLLNQYGQNILEDKAEYMQYAMVDGQIWRVPRASYIYPPTMSVRTDWMKNVGIEKTPETLDELYDLLYAFTYDDPDQNGMDDTTGLGFSINIPATYSMIFGAYGIAAQNGNYIDGKYTPYLMHPAFLDCVYYFRKLYQEGLMELDFATIAPTQSFENLWTGKYGVYNFSAQAVTNNWLIRYTEDPAPTWGSIVLKGPDGAGSVELMKSSMLTGLAITTNCKNPARAIKLLDYMVSEEGDQFIYYGIEGKHYKDLGDGKSEYLEPYASDLSLHRAEGAYAYIYMMSRSQNNAEFRNLTDLTKESISLANAHVIEDAFITETPQIINDTGDTLPNMMNEAFATLIVSEGDVEKELAQYRQEFLDAGGQEWIDQATEIYKREYGVN